MWVLLKHCLGLHAAPTGQAVLAMAIWWSDLQGLGMESQSQRDSPAGQLAGQSPSISSQVEYGGSTSTERVARNGTNTASASTTAKGIVTTLHPIPRTHDVVRYRSPGYCHEQSSLVGRLCLLANDIANEKDTLTMAMD